MKNYKYVLNKGTGTLHKKEGCYNSNVWKDAAEYFMTEDDAISYGTRYIKHCKVCFKEQRN
ncbi:MAG: hypothetical protein IJA34_12585 [Lachnospiraceae bacterium]|nr:hypothetical protein [Lachnospiraceae bacterium]